MQCIGRTKGNKRCRNVARLVFCKRHAWQPVSFFMPVCCVVGFFAGFFQDLVLPLMDAFKNAYELKKPVSVRIERDRSKFADWEDGKEIFHGRSDVLTIFSNQQPVRSFEFYHKAKDQKFKNYPFTAKLYDEFVPTSIEYSILDLDGDGAQEIVVVLTNQIYGVHYDKQINVLIVSSIGDFLVSTPYPRDISDLQLLVHSPYSAYKTTAVVKDELSGKIYTSTFCNGFEIVSGENGFKLQFSWVVDNAAYASDHLHQVESYVYESGTFIPTRPFPDLYLSKSWDAPFDGERVGSIQEAKAFLSKKNLPPMNELINTGKNLFYLRDRAVSNPIRSSVRYF